MSSLMTTLGIDRWSVEQRLALLQEIRDSLGPAADDPPLTDAQKQELDRRLAAADADPGAARPWEEVEVRLLGKLGR